MTTLAPGLSWVDLLFQGQPHAIATGVISGGGELALVDPGPTTCLETLELGLQSQGLRLGDVTQILLTHVHLDHAAATGAIVARCPRATVYVHDRGAGHMANPEKLLASATRLYGDQMDRLWGHFAPVPRENLVALSGGERISVGGRQFEVAYTPGHASHHVGYFDASSGVAFVGDTAGVMIEGGYVLPPTPPPDIDIEGWNDSVARIERWDAKTLFLTHFGAVGNARTHLRTLMDNLATLAGFVREGLREEESDEVRALRFAERLEREFRRASTLGGQPIAYRLAAPVELLWLGLARYWRKRGLDSL